MSAHSVACLTQSPQYRTGAGRLLFRIGALNCIERLESRLPDAMLPHPILCIKIGNHSQTTPSLGDTTHPDWSTVDSFDFNGCHMDDAMQITVSDLDDPDNVMGTHTTTVRQFLCAAVGADAVDSAQLSFRVTSLKIGDKKPLTLFLHFGCFPWPDDIVVPMQLRVLVRNIEAPPLDAFELNEDADSVDLPSEGGCNSVHSESIPRVDCQLIVKFYAPAAQDGDEPTELLFRSDPAYPSGTGPETQSFEVGMALPGRAVAMPFLPLSLEVKWRQGGRHSILATADVLIPRVDATAIGHYSKSIPFLSPSTKDSRGQDRSAFQAGVWSSRVNASGPGVQDMDCASPGVSRSVSRKASAALPPSQRPSVSFSALATAPAPATAVVDDLQLSRSVLGSAISLPGTTSQPPGSVPAPQNTANTAQHSTGALAYGVPPQSAEAEAVQRNFFTANAPPGYENSMPTDYPLPGHVSVQALPPGQAHPPLSSNAIPEFGSSTALQPAQADSTYVQQEMALAASNVMQRAYTMETRAMPGVTVSPPQNEPIEISRFRIDDDDSIAYYNPSMRVSTTDVGVQCNPVESEDAMYFSGSRGSQFGHAGASIARGSVAHKVAYAEAVKAYARYAGPLGGISVKGLQRWLVELGKPVSDQAARAYHGYLDADGDGLVSLSDLMEWYGAD